MNRCGYGARNFTENSARYQDKGLHKPIQKQESLWAFVIPQFESVSRSLCGWNLGALRCTMANSHGPDPELPSSRAFTFSLASVLCIAISSITFYFKFSIMY